MRDPLPEGSGVDRLSLAFPVDSVDSHFEWEQVTVDMPGRSRQRRSYRGRVEVNGVKAFVQVGDITTGSRAKEIWGRLEFNPSRVVDPGGASLCSPEEARVVSLDVWRAAHRLVTPKVEADELVIKRLDVARDFAEVAEPGFYIRGLGPIPRRYARRSFVYNDPAKGCAETLYVGGKVGGVRLYDKHRESPEATKPGHVRWELEARGDWCGRAGIRTLPQLTAERVGALATARWAWSSMGAEIGGRPWLIERVEALDLSPSRRVTFLGYLTYLGAGFEPDLSPNTLGWCRRLVREQGFVLGPGAEADHLTHVGRLDWESGREVRRAA